MRKHILTGAGVCTVAVGLVLAASPAHAATNTYTYDCTGPITSATGLAACGTVPA